MPQNQNDRPTQDRGDDPFGALMKKLQSSEALGDKEVMSLVTEKLHENFLEIAKQQAVTSVLLKHRYDSLTKAGFTEDQAMLILLHGNA